VNKGYILLALFEKPKKSWTSLTFRTLFLCKVEANA
jgi:hypothetical protein